MNDREESVKKERGTAVNLNASGELVLRPDKINCEEAEILISRHLDGELEPSRLPPLKSHLRQCNACRSQAEAWAETSFSLGDSISTLWAEEISSRATSNNKAALSTAQRGAYWLPLSMLASQAVAIVGLAVYVTFFASPAQAPRTSVRVPEPKPVERTSQPAPLAINTVRADAPKPSEPAHVAAAAQSLALPRREISYSIPIEEPIETEVAVAEPAAPSNTPLATPPVFAAPLPPVLPRLVSNVSMDFQSGERFARITLLGDIASGKAVIRMMDPQGRVVDVAQGDVSTLLAEPERSAVRRFLAACAAPELLARFKALK